MLLQALLALENASFASPANERHLAATILPQSSHQQPQHRQAAAGPSHPEVEGAEPKGQAFIAWLLQFVNSLVSPADPAKLAGSTGRAKGRAAVPPQQQPQQYPACLPEKGSVHGQVLQSTLSVLMNVTHENPDGCSQVNAAAWLSPAVVHAHSVLCRQLCRCELIISATLYA